jgi:molybdenum cofactor synthesis domain-containing protein
VAANAATAKESRVSRIRAAVLTISDSAYSGKRIDSSGPAVATKLASQGIEVVLSEILPDEREVVAERVRELAQRHTCEAIFTTGGTGLSERDVTPEAMLSVVERVIPGFGELMRAEGLKTTRRAALSRSMAGTLGNVLIVNLPGSPSGAVESLDAIVELVPHAVGLLQGHTEHAPAVSAKPE